MLDATLTSKGQVTIPVDIRKLLGLKSGDKISFYQDESGEVRLLRKKRYTLDDLIGCVPKPARKVSIKQMRESIEQEAVQRFARTKKPRTGVKKK